MNRLDQQMHCVAGLKIQLGHGIGCQHGAEFACGIKSSFDLRHNLALFHRLDRRHQTVANAVFHKKTTFNFILTMNRY